jgi:hypothetical protein
MNRALLLAAAFSSAAALCPAACSGHGTCGQFDKCSCYDNWTGPDCSLRVCPFSEAWSDAADTTVSGRQPHYYAECGNKGECDRSSGLCQCYEGYTGKGCQRLNCEGEGNCNGHGTCETLLEVNSGYTGWDKEKIMYCKCDPGYSGPGCASRMCKTGNDPLSVLDSSGAAEIPHMTTIEWESTAAITAGEVFLTYTDWRGETWETWVLNAATMTALSVEEALQGLPNHAVPDVTVADCSTQPTYGACFEVTYDLTHNSGSQSGKLAWGCSGVQASTSATDPEIAAGCDKDGCQPRVVAFDTPTNLDFSVADSSGSGNTPDVGTSEGIVCSGRGHCDSDSGSCVCLEGYYGEMCHMQTTII